MVTHMDGIVAPLIIVYLALVVVQATFVYWSDIGAKWKLVSTFIRDPCCIVQY